VVPDTAGHGFGARGRHDHAVPARHHFALPYRAAVTASRRAWHPVPDLA